MDKKPYGSMQDLFHALRNVKCCDNLMDLLNENHTYNRHGNLNQWKTILNKLPDFIPNDFETIDELRLKGDFVQTSENVCAKVTCLLKKLCPWRKGPIYINDLHIDTEWRSSWKWQRLKKHITPLKNRIVLDVGCGNGYYLYHMFNAGARWALGLDCFLLYTIQFWALRHFVKKSLPIWVLPLNIDEFPENFGKFDTVFSMGVIYHHPHPLQHLKKLFDLLRPGGELVLESLVVSEPFKEWLIPSGPYAKMRNISCIPSCLKLQVWFKTPWLHRYSLRRYQSNHHK